MNFKYYKTVPLISFIIVLAVLGALMNYGVGKLFESGTVPGILADVLGIGSIVAYTTVGLVIVNRWGWVWKLKSWKVFGWLIDLPDLRGRYSGKLISNFQENGQKKEMNCVIEITQTGSEVKVFSYYHDPLTNQDSSTSTSIVEEIIKEANGLFKVHFMFSNKPGTHQEQLMDHDGTAWILYYPDVKKIKMEYYNKRGNNGNADAVFEQSEVLGRFEG